MAERRMFARKIVESAKFLKLPSTSQNLYFHLGINADDDGVVEAYTVLNLIRANEDDLKVLIAKGFVQILNEDLVTYIVHWRDNNKVRADRKVDSIYQELLIEFIPNVDLLEKKHRSDTKTNKETKLSPMDGPWTEQYSGVKDSIEKYSKEECKYKLGEEELSILEYEKLISHYSKNVVDFTIQRIMQHPYVNCLNVETISKWCNEIKKRTKSSQNLSKNKFNNFNQRNYDFDKLEQALLFVGSETKVGRG
ncbi:replisome organizer [Anaerosacchariphilus polymeriproducens]|uniref:Replisome organizer n=1 Tax=Anaerosacchariphilus polymeriproducens TaxID=1812858 RepID=A0A371AV25_9FIRM|nr:replisome organizer [Anaerosacchariphilus polymeriproducens]RDU23417.1 replisome organizer [Anaerosacchariphilus polymeriproducens]